MTREDLIGTGTRPTRIAWVGSQARWGLPGRLPCSSSPRSAGRRLQAMRRDIRQVLFLIGEAVIIVSAIASTIIVAALALNIIFL